VPPTMQTRSGCLGAKSSESRVPAEAGSIAWAGGLAPRIRPRDAHSRLSTLSVVDTSFQSMVRERGFRSGRAERPRWLRPVVQMTRSRRWRACRGCRAR
jgi:hypothetical protein